MIGSTSPRERAAARPGAVVGALILVCLLCLSLASSAFAGLPTHQPAPALDLNGSGTPAHEFNHACGVASDTQGDVYVASAGTSAIDVFDSKHEFLTAIPDGEEPCGLAVSTDGGLYVLERKSGKVVEYKPNFYPFAGTPIYGLASVIDASGSAKGISVDRTDNGLYVAEGARVSMYDAEGRLGIDEVQGIFVGSSVGSAIGGSYTLAFKGKETTPLPYNSTPVEVQEALEALSTIGAGNVSVADSNGNRHVTFQGALGNVNVEQIACDKSGLTGTSPLCLIETATEGFDGHIGEGELGEAVGVAAYTYPSDHYLSVADRTGNKVEIFAGGQPQSLVLRRTIDGSQTPDGGFGFGAAGASLAVDPGTQDPVTSKCVQVGEEACTAGHLLVYDAAHKALDEFDASGEYLDRISGAALVDAGPTAMAVERSGGPDDGTIYLTAGAGSGSQVLVFSALPEPGRASLAALSHTQPGACGVAVDSHGDVYTAGESSIRVFDPAGKELTSIEDEFTPCNLAVDDEGDIYVVDLGANVSYDEKVDLYKPKAYPPVEGTSYGTPTTIEKILQPQGLTVDPADGHLFVTHSGDPAIVEYDSAAHGSGILNPYFAPSIFGPKSHKAAMGVGVYGANGDVYVAEDGTGEYTVRIFNPAGTQLLATINGVGSPAGVFTQSVHLAVDQRNGHVLVYSENRGAAEEYDASGAFVARFGSFQNVSRTEDIAVDDSGGATDGNVYVAYDEPEPGSPDVWAFGPLSYGEPPVAVTGSVGELSGGEATLGGTVDPRGIDLEACRFEYLTQGEYEVGGESFVGAAVAPCAQSTVEIGKGSGPVAVSAKIAGLQTTGHYRFRLVAENKYGESDGSAVLFGPPTLETETALVLYSEATVRGKISPSGMPTSYHVDYGMTAAYGSSTAEVSLGAGETPVQVEVPLFGFSEGSEYHFRVVARSEAGTVEGPDQTFVTLEAAPAQDCPNAAYRTGASAQLSDCRAYELVTPADTGVENPRSQDTQGFPGFNHWVVDPSGPGAGDSVSYFVEGAIPGMESNGARDGLRAVRGADGWHSQLFGMSLKETGNQGTPFILGMAPEQQYSIWTFRGDTTLRGPVGVEELGRGSLGVDPSAESDMLTGEARHVVFSSGAHLEPAAPAAGTKAVYDRSSVGPTEVVSLLPGDVAPAEKEDASYLGISEDGSAIAFEIGGVLYVRRGGETVQVAALPYQFAGLSNDGSRIFYTTASFVGAQSTLPGTLYRFDVVSATRTKIADNSRFTNVAADGSRVYFTSTDKLDDAGEGVPGAENLYVWDGSGTRLVAVLPEQDLESFSGGTRYSLASWLLAVAPHPTGAGSGRGVSPTRSTADGAVLVFQSHGDLTGQDPGGYSEVYRYDTGSGSIICVSCNPDGEIASGETRLQIPDFSGVSELLIADTTLIPNVTEDGQSVVFESEEGLVPQDVNGHRDVYEWHAHGVGGCERASGCVVLVSTGHSGANSYLYSMTPDGHDIFIWTSQKLVGEDLENSPSIYDARIDGGFPPVAGGGGCVESACQNHAAGPPEPPVVGSATFRGAGNIPQSTTVKPAAKKKKVRKPARHKGRRHRKRGAKRGAQHKKGKK